MLSTVKVSSIPCGSHHFNDAATILATSAATEALNSSPLAPHRYLDDFKPFSNVYSAYNITLQATKAVLLPANILLNDFNMYMDQFDPNDPDANDEIPPYNWDAALNKFMRSFVYDGSRFLITSVLRKAMEEYMLHNLSLKLTDQYTKDITKSLLRKNARFGTHQRLEVCRRMFFTSWRATSLTYLSFCVYDSTVVTVQHAMRIYTAIMEEKKSVGEALQLFDLPALLWKITKKIIFQVTSLTAQSLGFAAGSYFHLKYGGAIGGTLFEILAGAVLAQFISTNDDPGQVDLVRKQLDEIRFKRAQKKGSKKSQ